MKRIRRSANRKKWNHCSKCGDPIFTTEEVVLDTHHCDPAVLERIAIHTDEAMTREPEPRINQSYYSRLSNGFAMMDDDYEPE